MIARFVFYMAIGVFIGGDVALTLGKTAYIGFVFGTTVVLFAALIASTRARRKLLQKRAEQVKEKVAF